VNQERSQGKLICYAELTGRTTLHPILHSRIGPDQFVSRMARLRDDARFKAVQPDAFDTESAPDAGIAAAEGEEEELDEGLELWFDWAFVDFWKNHYCKSCPLLCLLTCRHHSKIYCDRPGRRSWIWW
jgi:hypothetical protein